MCWENSSSIWIVYSQSSQNFLHKVYCNKFYFVHRVLFIITIGICINTYKLWIVSIQIRWVSISKLLKADKFCPLVIDYYCIQEPLIQDVTPRNQITVTLRLIGFKHARSRLQILHPKRGSTDLRILLAMYACFLSSLDLTLSVYPNSLIKNRSPEARSDR